MVALVLGVGLLREQLTIGAFGSLGYVADIKIYPGVGHSFLAATDDVSACLQAGVRAATAAP